MKKILLTLLILFTGTAFADEITSVKQGYQQFHEKCMQISKNFKADHLFSNYLLNRCLLFESDRTRMVAAVFPSIYDAPQEYRNSYPSLKAQFIAGLNTRELANYKALITEYCKYNQYKFVKKDPAACSPERVNTLFN